MLQERRGTGHKRIGAADLAELGCNVPVIQVWIIAALAADDFERAGVVFRLAGAETGWLAPECD